MRPQVRRRIISVLGTIALAGTLFTAPTPAGHAASGVDMSVTLSVYTCCGSLQGFNSNDPTNVYSIYNIFHSRLVKAFPGLHWQETNINSQDALETKLTLAVNSGNPPDMVFIQGGYMGFSVLRKLAQPLDKYFAQYHIADNYFLPSMAKWAHFGGHWWGIPAVSGPQAGQLVYLPRYMSQLGYNNSNLKTFSDLYQMSRKAVQFDKSGNLTRIGYWPVGAGAAGVFWQTTGRLFCPSGHGIYDARNQPTAADPCNVKAMNYLKQLSDLYGGYTRLSKFLSGDPQIWNGSPKDYMVSGKTMIASEANAYWSITPFDTFTFGVKGGVQYNLTPLPPTVDGTTAEAANYPSTQQVIIIPPGAKHPDAAFLASKFISWDNGYLLGPSTNGSPVAQDQQRWVNALISGEAGLRQKAGMAGNPSATLEGIKLQPALARASQTYLPLNPVDVFYQDQLSKATARVLYGQQSPAAALAQVQRLVLADEQRLQ
ncbi:MAG TPA: extracellular solute-binding protein, partial [Chloroflexota bacterium]|nr:extracellular solute-binding protein [Chloroflexota bacterium]